MIMAGVYGNDGCVMEITTAVTTVMSRQNSHVVSLNCLTIAGACCVDLCYEWDMF